MTRKEEIKNASIEYTLKNRPKCICGDAFAEMADELNRNPAFEEGAKWADENPNKNLVYTKKELLDMGFGFDLNGNISTPQEIEERTKKYINYRRAKWIEKACEWLIEQKELIGISFQEDFIERFKQAMEK